MSLPYADDYINWIGSEGVLLKRVCCGRIDAYDYTTFLFFNSLDPMIVFSKSLPNP